MGIADRVGKAEGVLAFWDRLIAWGPTLLGVSLSGSLAAWASAATKVLADYGPISWVIAAIIGACSFLLGNVLWSAAKLNTVRLEYARELAKRTPSFNPLGETFTKQRIDLQTFRNQFNEPVTGKTFVDCELVGPALVILAGNVSMSDVGIGNCEFVKVRDRARIFNGIPFLNLTVTRGKMRGLTIIVPESAVDKVN